MELNEAIKLSAELRERIEYHSNKYYTEDAPEISDFEYDMLYRKLEDIEKEFPELADENSPTSKVGSVIYNTFAPVVHAVALESLHDSFSEDELREFDRKVRAVVYNPEYVVEPKIDGLSVALEYENGVFIRGATRGDGTTGEDVTENIRTIKTVPKKLKEAVPHLIVRGEVYMSDENFEKLCERQELLEEKIFKNPRNAAAGSLRQKDPKVTATRELDIFIFNVQEISGINLSNHDESLKYLKKLGFTVSPAYKKFDNIEEIISFVRELGNNRGEMKFPIDGAVIKVNKFAERDELGSTAKFPRWAEAYKYPPEEKETEVLSVEINVGRTGVLTPTAIFEPILLSGSTVARATLHNQDFITEKDIRIGSKVIVRKAGEIIPEVVSVISNPKNSEKYFLPQNCPSCLEKVLRIEGEAATRCTNPQCPAQLSRNIIHFASRDAMDIDGLGPAIVEQLIEEKLISSPADLYLLEAEQLGELERFGKKSAENLMNALEKSKQNNLDKLIFALGIPHIGAKAAKLLCEVFSSVEAIMKASVEEMSQIDGFGEIMAKEVSLFFQKDSVKELVERFKNYGLNMEMEVAEKGTALSGFTFVITGTLPNMGRKEAADLIEKAGGKVSSSVSKKTSYVLAGEEAGSKLEKANTLGVAVITEQELLDLIK